MADRENFWRLGHLSDRQLLERLHGVLRTQRCALAELVAHLGEVEERRLHLAAAHGSMFSYCVGQLGMSEDEACRRIELARLTRRFPRLFGELASGGISLSVALLLKPVLTPGNHAELIASARGASLRSTREMLAARFPSPDVPSRIRKLPGRLVADAMPTALGGRINALATGVAEIAKAIPQAAPAVARTVPVTVASVADVSSAIPTAATEVVPVHVTSRGEPTGTVTAPSPTSSPQPPRSPESQLVSETRTSGSIQDSRTSADPSRAPEGAGFPRHAEQRHRHRIDPLSAERYRVVFTADTSLKQKLELARDLLRHSHPSGDLAPILSRALDLLLQELLRRHFGARRKDTTRGSAHMASHASLAAAPPESPAAAPPATAPATAASTAHASTIRTPPAHASPAAASTAHASTAHASTAHASAATEPAAAAPPIEGPLSSSQPIEESASPPSLAASSAGTLLPAAPPGAMPCAAPASHIARAARRAVLERDGLGCAWVDATGKRCGSTAWLELDHQHPRGKGGCSEPGNLRLLCRAHNRFEAERTYGREHVERAIRARQRSTKRGCQKGQAPSSSQAPP